MMEQKDFWSRKSVEHPHRHGEVVSHGENLYNSKLRRDGATVVFWHA
jgi:hypothetical protein